MNELRQSELWGGVEEWLVEDYAPSMVIPELRKWILSRSSWPSIEVWLAGGQFYRGENELMIHMRLDVLFYSVCTVGGS